MASAAAEASRDIVSGLAEELWSLRSDVSNVSEGKAIGMRSCHSPYC